MAWTTPRTWLGALLTSASLNVDIRDNLNFLYGAPRCRGYRSAAKSIATATTTQYDLDLEDYDNDAMHTTGGSNTRFTIKTPGVYRFLGWHDWQGNGNGRRYGGFRVNGSAVVFHPVNHRPTATGECGYTFDLERLFALNDYVEMDCFQDSGGALNLTATMTARWVGN